MAHRTALITAGLLAALIFAGAVAVGANLGILNAADSRPVGKLSAATQVQTGGSEVVKKYAGTKKTAPVSQTYVVKKAGSLEVAATRNGVRLMNVKPNRHWTWTLAQTANKKLTVTFHHGSAIYTFVAALGRGGAIVARVDKPVTKVVTVPSSGGSSTGGTTAVATAAAQPAPAPASQGGEPGDGEGGEADD